MENSLTYQLRGENPWACPKVYTTTTIQLENIKNLEGGPKSHSAEKKIQRGDHLGSSGFVGYLEKVKYKRGPFGLSFCWPDLALVVSVKSRHFSMRSVV